MNANLSVDHHFEGKAPFVRSLYDQLLRALQGLGPVQESSKQGSIHLDRKTGFAGVYPRQQYLLVHFRTDYPIESPRIQKKQQLSSRRYKHTIKLDDEYQIDAELLGWLKDASHLAG